MNDYNICQILACTFKKICLRRGIEIKTVFITAFCQSHEPNQYHCPSYHQRCHQWTEIWSNFWSSNFCASGPKVAFSPGFCGVGSGCPAFVDSRCEQWHGTHAKLFRQRWLHPRCLHRTKTVAFGPWSFSNEFCAILYAAFIIHHSRPADPIDNRGGASLLPLRKRRKKEWHWKVHCCNIETSLCCHGLTIRYTWYIWLHFGLSVASAWQW